MTTFSVSSFPLYNKGRAPSVSDQTESEKYATRSNSSQNHSPYEHQSGIIPKSGSMGSTPNQKQKRKKWTRKGYVEVIYCYYYALEKPGRNNTNDLYTKWCSQNTISYKFDKLNANKLANQRRYIVRNKKLTGIELIQMKEKVMNDMGAENKNKDS